MSGVGSTEPLEGAEAAAWPPPAAGKRGVGSTEPLEGAEAAAWPPPAAGKRGVGSTEPLEGAEAAAWPPPAAGVSHPSGFGQRQGPGRRPALLVVDMSLGFTSPDSPLACELDGVVVAIARLLEAARAHERPVVYTTVTYSRAGRETARAFVEKVPALLALEQGSPFTGIDSRLAPLEHEPVLEKLFASAFFGTPLQSFLVAQSCDSVVVTGASTSGCVRATAVDVLQHGYRLLVPREAVGDRDPAAHEQALLDIDCKYGDVVGLDEALAVLAASAAGPG